MCISTKTEIVMGPVHRVPGRKVTMNLTHICHTGTHSAIVSRKSQRKRRTLIYWANGTVLLSAGLGENLISN